MGRPGLSNHPKFRRLAQVLGSAALARGHLELLWEVAYENGDPVLGDPVAVEACAQWAGAPGALHEALRDAGGPGRVGFIEERGGVWEVHDLYDHAPDYVRKRAKREAERRTTGRTLAAEVRSLTGQSPPNGSQRPPNGTPPAPAPAPAPAPTEDLRTPSAPRTPKRRTPPTEAPDGTDHAYTSLVDALFVIFRDDRGRDPQPDGKNWAALKRLRARHPDAEIIRRWGNGVPAKFKRRTSSFVDLEAKWDECGDAEPAAGVNGAKPRTADEVMGFPSRLLQDEEDEKQRKWIEHLNSRGTP